MMLMSTVFNSLLLEVLLGFNQNARHRRTSCSVPLMCSYVHRDLLLIVMRLEDCFGNSYVKNRMWRSPLESSGALREITRKLHHINFLVRGSQWAAVLSCVDEGEQNCCHLLFRQWTFTKIGLVRCKRTNVCVCTQVLLGSEASSEFLFEMQNFVPGKFQTRCTT